LRDDEIGLGAPSNDSEPTPADVAVPRVSSGVAGLDLILGGGFLREGFYLVQGDPGSGKTTVALQFARACVHRGESVLYISITESRTDLERTAQSHGWTLDGVQLLDLSRDQAAATNPDEQNTLFYHSEVELVQMTRLLLDEVKRVQPKNVIFDGLSELRLLAGDPFTYRRQILALKNYFADHQITVLVLDDRTTRTGESTPETLVGGNILLERSLPGYGGARVSLEATGARVRGITLDRSGLRLAGRADRPLDRSASNQGV